jgi:DtxR family Mn-dependent transcriptional regulator
LRYLGEIGLRPGASVTVLEKAPLGGPVTVSVNGAKHAVSLELARMVTVVEHDSSDAVALT